MPAIGLLIRHQLRYLARTPAATAAQVFGTALGVASLVAVHLVSERIKAELDANAPREVTHLLRGAALDEDAYFELRARWRSGQFPDVEAMVPVVEGHAWTAGRPRRLSGMDLLADRRPGETDTNVDGGGDGDAITDLLTRDAVLAGAALGFERGDVIRLNDFEVSVVGTFGTTADGFLADIATARRILGRDGPTAVWLRTGADDPVLERWLPGSTAGFRQAGALHLGEGLVARPLAEAEPTRRFALALLFNLGALGLLALFVSTFLIYQSAHANVTRRAASDAQLAALGVSRGTLRTLFVGEGTLLGLAGAGLGVCAGWALAVVLMPAPTPSSNGVSLSAVAIAKGGIGGISVAAFGALAASRQSAKPNLRLAWAAGAAVLLLASVASDTLAASFGIVLALCLLQVAVLVPGTGTFLARLLARGQRRIAITRRAAMRSATGQLAEVHVAVGALSVAVAAAIGIGVMVESFRQDFVGMLEQRLWDGIQVETTATLPGVPASLDDLRASPGVVDVRAYARAPVTINGLSANVLLTRGDIAEARRYGYGAPFQDAILLNEAGARTLAAGPGDAVRVAGGRGARMMRVVHVFRDYGVPGPRIVAAVDHVQPILEGIAYDSFSVRTGEGRATAPLKADLEARFPTAEIRDQSEIRRRALDVFDRTFLIASQLTLIALLVAVAGLYNALSELQARRRGENRLLYTLGVGRGRIASLAMQQNALIGLAAAVLGIPLGLAIAWVLCTEVNPRAFGWSIPWTPGLANVLPPVSLGVAAALLAGLGPTWVAARTVTGAAQHEA